MGNKIKRLSNKFRQSLFYFLDFVINYFLHLGHPLLLVRLCAIGVHI